MNRVNQNSEGALEVEHENVVSGSELKVDLVKYLPPASISAPHLLGELLGVFGPKTFTVLP